MKTLKFKKTSPRRLLYLVAIAIIGLLALFCNNARLKLYKNIDIANEAFLSTHLKQDTEQARYVFYAKYRLNTDYIERTATTGSSVTFINVCQARCDLFKDTNEFLKLCNELSSEYRFGQYRVYNCTVKVTLENDQPLMCKAIDNGTFKSFCNNFSFAYNNITFNSRQYRE